MDTGVAPVDIEAPPVAPENGGGMPKAIKFAPWKKECKVQRVTGTQWQESDSEAASKLWEDLEERKSPHLLPVSGDGLVFRCSLLRLFVIRSCGGGQHVL